MSRSIIFYFFIFISLSASAQPTEKVVEKHNDGVKEIYHVLKSDGEIKQGNYKRFEYEVLQEEGYFKNNLKDSVWYTYGYDEKTIISESWFVNGILNGPYTEYDYTGKIELDGTYANGKKSGEWIYYSYSGAVSKRGFYTDDKRSGEWEFYNKGILEQKYNYTTKQLIYDGNESSNKNFVINDQIMNTRDTLDYGALYIGGTSQLYEFISQELYYPRIARDNAIEGTVIIVFTVDDDSKVRYESIKQGIGGGCDEEALRVILLTSGNWIPARDDGKNVPMKFTVPFKFSLE